jgi:hypothetical protein
LEDRFALRNEKLVKANQSVTFFINNSILTLLHFIDTKFNEFTKIILNEVKEIDNRIEKME